MKEWWVRPFLVALAASVLFMPLDTPLHIRRWLWGDLEPLSNEDHWMEVICSIHELSLNVAGMQLRQATRHLEIIKRCVRALEARLDTGVRELTCLGQRRQLYRCCMDLMPQYEHE